MAYQRNQGRRRFIRYNCCKNNNNWSSIITNNIILTEQMLVPIVIRITRFKVSQNLSWRAVHWWIVGIQLRLQRLICQVSIARQTTCQEAVKTMLIEMHIRHPFKAREMKRARELDKVKDKVESAQITRSTKAMVTVEIRSAGQLIMTILGEAPDKIAEVQVVKARWPALRGNYLRSLPTFCLFLRRLKNTSHQMQSSTRTSSWKVTWENQYRKKRAQSIIKMWTICS